MIRLIKRSLSPVALQTIAPLRHNCRNPAFSGALFNNSYNYFTNDYIPIKDVELRKLMTKVFKYGKNGDQTDLKFRILGSQLLTHMIQKVKSLKEKEAQKNNELSRDQLRVLSSEFYKKIQELISKELQNKKSDSHIYFKQELTEHLRRYFILSLKFFDKLSLEGGVLSSYRPKSQQDEQVIYLLGHFRSDVEETQHDLVDQIVGIIQKRSNFKSPVDIRVHIIDWLLQRQKEGSYCQELINHFISFFDTSKQFAIEGSQSRFQQGSVFKDLSNTFNPISEISSTIFNLILVRKASKNVYIIGPRMLGKSFVAQLAYLLDRRRMETMMYISQIDDLFALKHMGMAMFEACWNKKTLQTIQMLSQFAVKSQEQLLQLEDHLADPQTFINSQKQQIKSKNMVYLKYLHTLKQHQQKFIQLYSSCQTTITLIDQCNYFTRSEKSLKKKQLQNANSKETAVLQQIIKLNLNFLKDVLRFNRKKMVFLASQNVQNARFKSIVENARYQNQQETIYKRLMPFKSTLTYMQILNFEIERLIQNVKDKDLIKKFLGNSFGNRLILTMERFNYSIVKYIAQLGVQNVEKIKQCSNQRIEVEGSCENDNKIKISKNEELQKQIQRKVIDKRVYHLATQTANWISNSKIPNVAEEKDSIFLNRQDTEDQTYKERTLQLIKLIFQNKTLDISDLRNYQRYPLHLIHPQTGKVYSILTDQTKYFYKWLEKRMFNSQDMILEQENRRIKRLLKYGDFDVKSVSVEVGQSIQRIFYFLCPTNREMPNLFLPKKYQNSYKIIQIGQKYQSHLQKIKKFSLRSYCRDSIIEIGYFKTDYNAPAVDFVFVFNDPDKMTLNIVLTQVGINKTLDDFEKIQKNCKKFYIDQLQKSKFVTQNLKVKWHLWILTSKSNSKENHFQQLQSISKQGIYPKLLRQNNDKISQLKKKRQKQTDDQGEIQSKIKDLQIMNDQYQLFLKKREQEAKDIKVRHTLRSNFQSFRISNIRKLNPAFQEYSRLREQQRRIQQLKMQAEKENKNKNDAK